MPVPVQSLSVGQVFDTREKFEIHLLEISHQSGHSFARGKRDRTYMNFSCPVDACQWAVKTKMDQGNCRVWHVEEHTCSPGAAKQVTYGLCKFVANRVEQKVRTKPMLYPSEVAKDLTTFSSVDVSTHIITKALRNTRQKVLGSQGDQFGLIAAFLQNLKSVNPAMSYDIVKTQSTFTRAFWCFLDGRAFPTLSPIIHSDACHLSGAFRGTLYITVGMDAERHIFPLCFSTSNVSENKDGWAYHHSQMAAHFGKSLERAVLFSDRQKGLEGDTTLENKILHHACCLNHLVDNVANSTQLPKGSASTIMWQIAKAKSQKEAVKLLDSIVSKPATVYIKKTQLSRWSDAYWPKGVPRFNTYTSNAVECVNSIFREARKGSLLTLIQDTRRWTTDTLAKRQGLLAATLPPESPVPSVEKHIREQAADASLWEVTQLSKRLWELRQSLASKTVRLIDGCLTCNCYDFRKSNLPCAHTTKRS